MKKTIAFLFALLWMINAYSQNVAINDDGSAPNANAMLDVDVSTNDKGFLIPRLNTGQRVAIAGLGPADEGLTVYDSTTKCYWLWDGTQWRKFGMLPGDDWTLVGNAGTSALTNFLGTTDAVDLVFRTADQERMRVKATGYVGVNAANPTYRFTVNEQLNPFGIDGIKAAIAAHVYSDADGNDEYPIGVMGHVHNTPFGAVGEDYGYGVLGISEPNFLGGVGVMGTAAGTVLAFPFQAGMSGIYDVDRYSLIGTLDVGYYTRYVNDYNGNTYGGYYFIDNSFDNSALNKIGLYIYNLGSYGVKRGVEVRINNEAEQKIGFNINFDNTSITDATNGVLYRGKNDNAQGWGMLISSMGQNPTYLAGGGGIFSKSREFSVIGDAANVDGTGVVGMGQNYGSIATLMNGSGVSGGGRTTGVYGIARLTTGTGGVFVGNNAGPTTLVSGSGAAATGTEIGVFGLATGTSDCWGGYFDNGWGSFAYVGGTLGFVDYKINGPGSVSTIVSDLNEEPVNMFCPEAPEILFQDYGTGELVNGKAYIKMDPIFTKNIHVDKENPIKVFVQLEGDCKGVYVTNKTADGFEVVELQGGTSNVPFSWTVTATRADRLDESGNIASKHVGVRFPRGPKAMETKTLETKESQTQEDSDEKYIIKDDKEKQMEEVKEVELEKPNTEGLK